MATYQEKQDELLPSPFVDVTKVTAYKERIELPSELREAIRNLVEELALREIEARLPKLLLEKTLQLRSKSRMDSSFIGSIVCSLVSVFAGLLSVQMAVGGNLAVSSALACVTLVGIVGL